MTTQLHTFTVRTSIRELVAASVARAEAAKVKLLATLMWVHTEAKRILERMLNPRESLRLIAKAYAIVERREWRSVRGAEYRESNLIDTDWPALPFVPSPTPVAEPAVLKSLAAKSQEKQDRFAAVTNRIMADEKPATASDTAAHFCPHCHRTWTGTIADDIWSCPCCPFRLNLTTGETVKPFNTDPKKGEYIRVTAEYVSMVMARSNTVATVRSRGAI